jgi:MATE family multidrug resistance protein
MTPLQCRSGMNFVVGKVANHPPGPILSERDCLNLTKTVRTNNSQNEQSNSLWADSQIHPREAPYAVSKPTTAPHGEDLPNKAPLDGALTDAASPSNGGQLAEPHNLPVRGAPGSFRELLAIAVPLIVSSGTQSMMYVIDRVFLTWHSEAAVAAALPAGMLFWSLLSLPFGVVSYGNAFVAQYDGARQPGRAASCVWQTAYLAVASGLVLTIPALWSAGLFQLIGHGEDVQRLETEYFSWICMGAVPALLSAALSCFFSGRGQTRLVLAVNASSMLVNVVLDYAMIFGWGPIPALGMTGAAIATNLASVFAACCYVVLLTRRDARVTYSFWKHWRFDRILMRDLFKFGGASGLQMFLDVAGFSAFMMIIGWIGQRELAATNIAFNINTLAFLPVVGVGIAVSTLVGQRIGEGRPDIAEKSVYKAFVLAGGIMLLCGAVYVLAPQILLAPYEYGANNRSANVKAPVAATPATATLTDSPRKPDFAEVRSVVIVLLRFVAIYSFFDAMAIIFGSAIRAAGDTAFSMVVTFVCAWGLLVLPTYLTWTHFGRERQSELLFWSWVWCSVYVFALGFIYYARFRGGHWKTMSVIEPEAVFHDEAA